MSAHVVMPIGGEWEAVAGEFGPYVRNLTTGLSLIPASSGDAASLEKAAGEARLMHEAREAAKEAAA